MRQAVIMLVGVLGQLVVLVISATLCSAGGTWESVIVESLDVKASDDFIVVLGLRENPPGWRPWPGSCLRVEIRGTYGPLYSWLHFSSHVTQTSHRAALRRLQKALESREPVNFGVIGDGLHPVGVEHPCSFESRALRYYKSSDDEAVLSYWSPG